MKPSEVAYESLGPIADDDENGHLLRLVKAIFEPLDRINGFAGERVIEVEGEVAGEVKMEEKPGWSLLFAINRDPDLLPAFDPGLHPELDPDSHPELRPDRYRAPKEMLPWTAQFVGSSVTPAMNDADARAAIITPVGFSRGLAGAVRAAGERTLTGTRRLIIHPRSPDDLTVYVRTLNAETPDVEATRAVLRAQIPWWLNLNYVAAVGLDYDDVGELWMHYDDIESGVTYGEIEEMLP